MPLYEYECGQCGHRFEKIEKVGAPARKQCPECGGDSERLLAAPAIQFKGSGWYVTDYARQAKGKTEGKDKTESKEKPEAKPAADSTTKKPAAPPASDT